MAPAVLRSRFLIAALSLLLPVAARAQIDSRRAETQRDAPVRDTLASLSAGGGSTCLTTTSGAGWCWGELGLGRRGVMRMHDEQGRPLALRTLSPWGRGGCGLSKTSEVLCDVGLTGGWFDSLRKESPPPPACRDDPACLRPLVRRGGIPFRTARWVSAGGQKACALAPNGTPYCWGGDTLDAFTAPYNVSVPLRDSARKLRWNALRFSQFDAGWGLICGVTQKEGAIHCWGSILGSQPAPQVDTAPCPSYAISKCEVERPTRVLPEGAPREQIDPWQVRFEQVSAGMGLGCGVDVRGDAYCWGNNYRCTLGRCRTPDSYRAQRIPIAGRVAEIRAGRWHACARTVDGRLFCWGNNAAGQLGSLTSVNEGPDGLPPDYRDTNPMRKGTWAYSAYDPCIRGGRCSPVPVEVAPGKRWSALAVGTDHACALASDDGAVYCWGGSDPLPLGGVAPAQMCINRSPDWEDVRCQAFPVRVAGLPRLAPPAVRVDSLSEKGWVRVRVSRQEIRAEFRTDTTRGWGWPPSLFEDYRPMYDWSVSVPGMDGPQHLAAPVSARTREAREFSSLTDLVLAAEPMNCDPGKGMILDCRPRGLRASGSGDVVTLVLRDSAKIARLFGMRPKFVQASETRPDRDERTTDSARVEYVAPFIPVPDAATRADSARSRRRFQESINSISRAIYSGGSWGALSLVVGDSAPLRVSELQCTYDSCVEGIGQGLANSGWSVDDSTIARLQAPPADGRSSFLRPQRYLKALRPGKTLVRVHDVHGTSDTAASSPPPAHELQRVVSVTLPIGRVEITPRPDTVKVNDRVLLTARVLDSRGDSLTEVSVKFDVEGETTTFSTQAGSPTWVDVRTRGRKRIVARAGNHADTITVTVVDSLDLRKR